MKRRRKIALIAAGVAAALVLALAAAAVLVLRSGWFAQRVRARIVAEVERASGGRSRLASFSFDWKRMRAEVRGFVLHGTEEPGKPPLFRAARIAAGLKIVSLWRKKVDIESVEVERPEFYLIVYPDGRTNIPAPRTPPRGKRVLERIVDLSVRRFEARNGMFEVEGRRKTPFDFAGRNLEAKLDYSLDGPRYQGRVAMDPLDVRWGPYGPVPLRADFELAVLPNRLEVARGKLNAGATEVDVAGAITDVYAWTGALRYRARGKLEDVARIVDVPGLKGGEANAEGEVRFDRGISNYRITGVVDGRNAAFRQGALRLRDFTVRGGVDADPRRVEVRGIRAAGVTALPAIGGRLPEARVEGRVESMRVRDGDIDFSGVRVTGLGGAFTGSAQVREGYGRFKVEGQAAAFDARQLVALYSPERVPWDAHIAGPVTLEGRLRRGDSLSASARLAVTPAGAGPPVTGSLAVAYDQAAGAVDLGQSYLQLPATRADFSGVLGRALDVRVVSRDLADLAPVLGGRNMPVKLENGTARFEGRLTGPLDGLRVAGRAALAGFAYQGAHVDSAQAAVTAARNAVSIENGVVTRGKLRAQVAGEIALREWRVDDAGPLNLNFSVAGAPVAELAALAGRKDAPVTGTVTASARITGAAGDPHVDGEATLLAGALYGEPFDSAVLTAKHAGDRLETIAGQLTAGAKRVDLKASYHYQPGDAARGRLTFDARSNAMALEQIRTVREGRPGLAGTLRFAAAGALDATPHGLRLVSLTGEATTANVRWNGRALGDAHLAAATKGEMLTAMLTSDAAGAVLRGEGEWRLAGDYPGSARLRFTNFDFVRLWDLISPPAKGGKRPVVSALAGEATVSGPAFEPKLWQARATAPSFQIGPAPDADLAAPKGAFTLKNAGPIEVSAAKGVVKVERARFVGRATDLTLTGSLALEQKNVYDLRLNGRVDLASLEDFGPDIKASGFLYTDAAVRGPINDPQVTGKLELKNAALDAAGVPNGIYNANGVLVFSGTRATIQKLTAESGGGQVRVGGFVGREGGQWLFRLFAAADHVRVRYPEGVSTVANAKLNWTGAQDRSNVGGTITIVRTGFNPRQDLSSILAHSAGPVRTPMARAGVLSTVYLDVQIETSPDITFESSLAQDIQIEASLRLRGTVTNPSLLGRVNITRGELLFFGTRYHINQGSVSFFNPSRIEPVVNVDLETKARGIDITLTVSGPLGKLNLTPRSDPPLQFSEIVALLATGRSPNVEAGQVARESVVTPQTWQQMGAASLLSQAIAAPVAGRLQRFFGVTKLKIDPSLTGVENNPQARLTLEQQISPNITFTYITNVTNSNPLVVQVEWAISRKWSVIAVRDENGLFGLDFLYKRRF